MNTNHNPWTLQKFCAFTEGEGCFMAYPRNRPQNNFHIRLTIQLRRDDSHALHTLQQFLNIGTVHPYTPSYSSKNSHPATILNIAAQPQCLQLVHIFDNYTFCTKKQYDYAVWRKIVILVNQKAHLNGQYDYILSLCNQLKRVRQYHTKSTQLILPPQPNQLSLSIS